jgi:hypothetical protein
VTSFSSTDHAKVPDIPDSFAESDTHGSDSSASKKHILLQNPWVIELTSSETSRKSGNALVRMPLVKALRRDRIASFRRSASMPDVVVSAIRGETRQVDTVAS